MNLGVFALAAVLLVPADARAAGVCAGRVPAAGAVIHGPVLDIPDSTSLCVAIGAEPSAWVRVRLPRGAPRGALMAAAFGRNATCVIGPDGLGQCLIEGQPLASAIHQPEVIKTATRWR